MRLAPAVLLTAALALTGCETMKSAADEAGRDASRAAVAEVIALHRPDVTKASYDAHVDCTVANADAIEVRQLAKASVAGIGDAEIATVNSILQRPGTAACIRSKS